MNKSLTYQDLLKTINFELINTPDEYFEEDEEEVVELEVVHREKVPLHDAKKRESKFQ